MELVIIGAGPVGLWTALQYKYRNPRAIITLYEKRKQYTRKHTVHVDEYSMFLYNSVPLNVLGHVMGLNVDHNYFTTHEIQLYQLERNLRRILIQMGVRFQHKHITHLEYLERKHPQCKLLVVADGSHSTIRQRLWGPDPETLIKQDLQHVVKLTGLTSRPNVSHVCKQVGAKEWLVFTEEEVKVPSTVQVHRFQLQCYMAKSTYTRYKHFHVYLLGDAAIGLPFFRSLNVGLINASLWAMHPGAYRTIHPLRGTWEMVKAHVKNTIFNTFVK